MDEQNGTRRQASPPPPRDPRATVRSPARREQLRQALKDLREGETRPSPPDGAAGEEPQVGLSTSHNTPARTDAALRDPAVRPARTAVPSSLPGQRARPASAQLEEDDEIFSELAKRSEQPRSKLAVLADILLITAVAELVFEEDHVFWRLIGVTALVGTLSLFAWWGAFLPEQRSVLAPATISAFVALAVLVVGKLAYNRWA